MIDTAMMTIVGNVVSDPRVFGDSAANPDRVTFRVVSNRRQRDAETGQWRQVGEFGMNVVCWRKLARGVAQALRKGDPVLVQGRVSERRYTGSDGQEHWHTELSADFVGHDLSQGYADRFDRFTRMDRDSRAAASGDPWSSAPGDADSSDRGAADEAISPTDSEPGAEAGFEGVFDGELEESLDAVPV